MFIKLTKLFVDFHVKGNNVLQRCQTTFRQPCDCNAQDHTICLLKAFLKFWGLKSDFFFLFERCLEFGLAELEIQCKQSLPSYTKRLYVH